jgi:hypothetical protein
MKGSGLAACLDGKALDPNHVVVIIRRPLLLRSALAQNGTADGLKWMRSLNVDMAVIHPRISFDDTASAFNTQNYALYSFAAYARRLGKIGTFALEDTGDSMRSDTVESYDRIASLAPMLASAGGGMGWAIESSTTGLPYGRMRNLLGLAPTHIFTTRRTAAWKCPK